MADMDFSSSFDQTVETALEWLVTNASTVFDSVRVSLDTLFFWIEWVLIAPHFLVIVLLAGAVGWWVSDISFGIKAVIGLLLCAFLGLWTETMSTLALITTSTVMALLIAIPCGILAGLTPPLNKTVQPVLDFIQTMPPYIYLLPGIALVGYGPATAICATVLVSIPPALRLTAHGIKHTPNEAMELGQASGARPMQMLLKIRLPFALPSIMAGVNQSIMLGFGMVVIAGIVGSGGLGEAVYRAVRTLEIGKSIDSGIAIVILSMLLDQMSRALVAKTQRADT